MYILNKHINKSISFTSYFVSVLYIVFVVVKYLSFPMNDGCINARKLSIKKPPK